MKEFRSYPPSHLSSQQAGLVSRPLEQLMAKGGLILLSLLWLQCAQPISPTGGPPDKVPPKVVRTVPENQSLQVSNREVRFIFDEPVRKPEFDKELFISPFVKRPKIIQSDNGRRIRIKFEEDLRPNTTYVLTLTGLADANAGNKMMEAYTLAFSTGDQLDSLEIKGRILSPVAGLGEKEMTVLLFDADSIYQNDIWNVRPAYLTKTDESGGFTFKYLRRTTYKVYGVKDEDQSNTYSNPSERVALSQDSVIQFAGDSVSEASATLIAFLPDDESPRLQNFAWLSPQSLSIRFDENLRLDSLHIWLTDTLNQDSQRLDAFTFYQGENPELLVHMPRPRSLYSALHLTRLQDSLWNRTDTILRVSPRRRRTPANPWLTKPELQVEKQRWEGTTYRLWQAADSAYLSLSDTSRVDSLRKLIPLRIRTNAFQLQLQPIDSSVGPGPFVLRLQGAFFQAGDSSLVDSTFRNALKWIVPEEYGTLSGKMVLDTNYTGPIILQLIKDKKVVRSVSDSSFAFTLLEPGSYTFRLILDADGNGIWSTGSLYPPLMPETILVDPNAIEIRANWDFDDHQVRPGAQTAPSTTASSPADSVASPIPSTRRRP